jgi:hypothetical protein
VAGVGQFAVVIPLEVVDVVLVEQVVEPLQDVGVRLGVGEVQDLLEAAVCGGAADHSRTR